MDAPGTPGASFPIDPASQAQQLRPGVSAAWSPDGEELVFADGGAIKNLSVLRVADPADVRALTAIDVTHTSVAWSPDGRRIAFVRRFSQDHRVSTIAGDGAGERLLFASSDTISPSANVDWRPLAAAAGNTPLGANVSVSLPGVTVTFSQVTGAGDTSVVSSPTGPPPPAGFRLVGTYHEISTTATYAGTVEVCIDGVDPQARLEHFDNGAWVDVTTSSSATRICGEVSSLSPFALFVPTDTRPPVLRHPDALTVDATSPSGVVVTYTATATDDVSKGPVVSCTPPSGATFAIGTTTVNCTATDLAGNSAAGSFVVTVRGAPAQIVALIDKTLAYLDLRSLEATLKARLEGAAAALIARNRPSACALLTLYGAAVKAAPAKVLTATQKAELVADVTRIRAVIGCP